MAAAIPIIGGLIGAVGSIFAATIGSKKSDPPAPTVPQPPVAPPEEAVVEPEGVIDEQLNRSRELARRQAAQSDQFLKLQQEPASASSLTKLTAKSGE